MQRTSPQLLRRKKLIAVAVLSVYAMPTLAEDAIQTEKIEVISTTPLKGLGIAKELVPANIQSIDGKEIQKQNNLSVADFLSNGIQGVNVNEVQNNPYQPNVNFHGFTASPLLGTPQGLSVFVDGVRVNEPFGDVVNWDLIPLNAISGMNLIPGSNPLFGLNTLGGALSVTTKSGRTDPGGSVEVMGGSWGRVGTSAEYGGVADNGIDYFVSANVFHEQGWRDASPSDVRQAFSKIGWQGEQTDANLSLTLADNELIGNGLVQKEFLDAQSYHAINTKPDSTENKMGFLNFNLNHYFNDETLLSFNTYYRNARSNSLNGDVNDDVDDADFVADCSGSATPDSACGGALNRSKSSRDSMGFTTQMTFNQDFLSKKNQFIAGIGYDYARTKFSQSTEFGNLTPSRGVAGVGLLSEDSAVKLKAKNKTYSIFATDTLSLSSMYHLTASARYNYTEVNNHDGLNPVPNPDPTLNTSLTGEHHFNRINPAIGLNITPSQDLTAYVSYNEGSRAPTAIELGCANPDQPCSLPNAMAGDPPLKQVVSKTYEAGVRGKLAEHLGYSASVYRTQNTDDIQFIASTASGAGYFSNVGKTRREGVDLGLDGTLGDDFRWSAGYSYIRATYQSDFSIVNEVNSSSNGDSIAVSKGDYLAGIPKHQLKLRGEWQATPNWSIGANVLAFASQYAFGNENNKHRANTGNDDFVQDSGKIRGYTIVNLDTRYQFGNTGWQLFGRVNNVFDKKYYTAGMLGETYFQADGSGFNGEDGASLLVSPGAPLAGWVGVRYVFGGKKSAANFDND